MRYFAANTADRIRTCDLIDITHVVTPAALTRIRRALDMCLNGPTILLVSAVAEYPGDFRRHVTVEDPHGRMAQTGTVIVLSPGELVPIDDSATRAVNPLGRRGSWDMTIDRPKTAAHAA